MLHVFSWLSEMARKLECEQKQGVLTLTDLGYESANWVLALVKVVVAKALVLHILAQITCTRALERYRLRASAVRPEMAMPMCESISKIFSW